jgi:general secretion pathway protein G
MRHALIVSFLLLASCGYKPGPEVKQTRDTMNQIAGALKKYHQDVGRWPKTLNLLLTKPDAMAPEAKKWKGPYLTDREIPKDAWGNDFVYNVPGKLGLTYDLISLGADGKPGGTKDDQDLAQDDKSLGIIKDKK